MKTISVPKLAAFSVPCDGMTLFDCLYTRMLGSPVWSMHPGDVTLGRAALDSLHDAPLTDVEISDAQHAILVELLRSTIDFARYGSLAIAIMEAV